METYDADYFERGIQTGKSGYQDYSWSRLGPQFQHTAQHIVQHLSPSSVLDVGCAKGFLVKALRELGVNAWGIDASGYAVRAAAQTDITHVLHGQAQALPFGDGGFDVVTALDVLEHIPETEVPQAISECLRVAKRLVIARIPTVHEPGDNDPTHCTIRPRGWWEAQFRAAGGVPEAVDQYSNARVWWFNLPDYLLVVRKR